MLHRLGRCGGAARPRPFCERGELAAPRAGPIATAMPRAVVHTGAVGTTPCVDGGSPAESAARRRVAHQTAAHGNGFTFVTDARKFVTRRKRDRIKMIARRRVTARFFAHSLPI